MRTILAATLALGLVAVASADGPRRGDDHRGRDDRRSSHDWGHGRSHDDGRRHHRWGEPYYRWSAGYYYRPVGWGTSSWYWDNGWYDPYYAVSYAGPGWGVRVPVETDSYASNGALLGGITGAIIGHQSGHTGRGALIGAGAGLLLGAIADSAQRRTEPEPATTTLQSVYPATPSYTGTACAIPASQSDPGSGPAETAAPVEQPPAKPASRMADANALFGR